MSIERAKAIITIIITAIINIANLYGYAVDADSCVTAALTVLSAITVVYSWWKNQNLTEAAIEGQKVIDTLKAQKRQ